MAWAVDDWMTNEQLVDSVVGWASEQPARSKQISAEAAAAAADDDDGAAAAAAAALGAADAVDSTVAPASSVAGRQIAHHNHALVV